MVVILSYSDSSPLSSVIIYWNIVVTTVNMFRNELFALGDWTNWLGTCRLYLKRGGTMAGQSCATEDAWGCCCCCVLLWSTAAKNSPGAVWLEESTLPVVVFGALCDCMRPLWALYASTLTAVWQILLSLNILWDILGNVTDRLLVALTLGATFFL
jgi:hypothetical protein